MYIESSTILLNHPIGYTKITNACPVIPEQVRYRDECPKYEQ